MFFLPPKEILNFQKIPQILKKMCKLEKLGLFRSQEHGALASSRPVVVLMLSEHGRSFSGPLLAAFLVVGSQLTWYRNEPLNHSLFLLLPHNWYLHHFTGVNMTVSPLLYADDREAGSHSSCRANPALPCSTPPCPQTVSFILLDWLLCSPSMIVSCFLLPWLSLEEHLWSNSQCFLKTFINLEVQSCALRQLLCLQLAVWLIHSQVSLLSLLWVTQGCPFLKTNAISHFYISQ